MKTKLKLHLLVLMFLSLAGFAHAQGTAISYQGRLNDGDLPATGLYDFTFHVFDAEVDGTDLAGPLGPLPYDAVPVTNGLFNVSLDFGPDIFSGPARWLEISVRASGIGDPSLLAPRTPLLPTPYAIFAGKAGSVANGTVTADQLNSGGIPPTPGQFLSYDGGNFLWSNPDVLVGNVWSRNEQTGDAYYNAGNVGIGTASPTAKLDVRGHLTFEAGASPGIFTGTGNEELNRYLYLLNSPTSPSASGFKAGGILVADSYSYANPGKNDLIVKGNVMIGTATPALSTRLTIKTTPGLGVSKWGLEQTDGTVRLATYVGDGGYRTGLGTRSNHPLSFFVNDGDSALTINTAGNVGIGTADPQVKLDVRGAGVLESTIWSVNERAILSLNSTLGGQNRIWTLESGVFGTPGLFGIYDRTAGRARLTIDTAGVVSVGVLRITGGADVAEPFQMKEEELAKGSVVVIDDEHPGRLKRSQSAYDTRVAGIVSGANGINPGIALHQEGVVEGGQNVALSGRVYVQADAAFGAIKPGDLLTTSDTPGHAMKVTEHGKAQGAILGKAMSELKTGKGMVLVLVTLQ
jgi:hypothetical protein